MRTSTQAFLASLTPAQRGVATYPFDTDERTRWQYTPGPRGGLAIESMDADQQALAMALLDAGLSEAGARTARGIMALEPILKDIEDRAGRQNTARRNAGHYWFSVFGDPDGDAWAVRVGGHHLCLHFTVVERVVAVTPLFFGANPARVPDGDLAGLRLLAAEEDLARALMDGLPEPLHARALVSAQAPTDILTGSAVRAEIAAVPTGVAYDALPAASQHDLRVLVGCYLDRVRRPPPVDFDGLTFAWAGSTERGEGHYYAVRGESFLIEYDNTQNHANHVHSVWRDLDRDWGEDLLAAHYRRSH